MIYVEKPCIKINACRANANMSQKDFAKALGVDPGTVFNWEHGVTAPDLPKLMKISEVSGVPLNLIFLPENS